jgi:hypothetical protein
MPNKKKNPEKGKGRNMSSTLYLSLLFFFSSPYTNKEFLH